MRWHWYRRPSRPRQLACPPTRHEMSVMPSGCFPSVRLRPAGSLDTGVPAAENALATMSLRAWCRAVLPSACSQTKLCRPLASTGADVVSISRLIFVKSWSHSVKKQILCLAQNYDHMKMENCLIFNINCYHKLQNCFKTSKEIPTVTEIVTFSNN